MLDLLQEASGLPFDKAVFSPRPETSITIPMQPDVSCQCQKGSSSVNSGKSTCAIIQAAKVRKGQYARATRQNRPPCTRPVMLKRTLLHELNIFFWIHLSTLQSNFDVWWLQVLPCQALEYMTISTSWLSSSHIVQAIHLPPMTIFCIRLATAWHHLIFELYVMSHACSACCCGS